ncbi:flagellar basal body-associated protein FliL [Paenibacillus endophyticus]|uniref:Flagellar basal body-associated protein FliL n=1 Tax=Paenibacillus endophyticus TaxID=1294268 RepID=A0A7W5C515_9BACL|nr:hypothetical protein [Paenibacillus endophyticus]MBB3151183.1 flagellar basal body-associated protein FliL [Paenibacillus endophyticus]
MSSPKRKPATMKAKPKDEVNKKALVWIGSIVGVVIIAVALLLVFTS